MIGVLIAGSASKGCVFKYLLVPVLVSVTAARVKPNNRHSNLSAVQGFEVGVIL